VDFLARVSVVDNGPHRNFQKNIDTLPSRSVGAFAVPPALGFVFWIKTEMHQRVVTFARFHDDIATLAAISAGRTSAWNKLLPPEGHAAIATVTSLYSNCGFIDEHERNLP
jgi:hypothetical protein